MPASIRRPTSLAMAFSSNVERAAPQAFRLYGPWRAFRSGYAPHEFRGFGIPLPQRLSRMEEGLQVLTRAFTGERFSFHGTRYDFDDVVIRPGYVQPGGPPLWIAAMSASGAARAARFDAHLLPQGERAQVLDPWREAVRAGGRSPDDRRVGIIRSCFVTDDP